MYLCDIPSQGSFLDVVIYADDVRPHECRRDDEQDRNGDNPETGNKFIRLQR